MLGRLFGIKKRNKSHSTLMFLCLRSTQPLDWTSFETVPGAERLITEEDGNSICQFRFTETLVSCLFMPMPIPNDEVEKQISHSRFWDHSQSTSHDSHLVILAGGEARLNVAASVAKVAAAVSKTADVVAWYVGNAAHVVSPNLGVELVESDIVLPLFVNAIVSQNANGELDATTFGLESFDQNEFEIVGSKAQEAEIVELLMDLSYYVLENGPVMKHGQTFGRTENERYKIEVGKSKLGVPGKVTRLALP